MRWHRYSVWHSVPHLSAFFLVMRRMSLVGDALSHAVLPGAAIGYIFAGLSLPAMSIGGFVAGMLMALLAGLVSRFTSLKEDANFAAFYLSSLAIGVILVSKQKDGNVDLLHLLFGSVLAVDIPALQLIAIAASVTIAVLATIYRPLVLESIDPLFLKAVGGKGGFWHVAFLVLVVMNLVAGFQALGTLMSVGLMMLPAITARLWAKNMGMLILLSVLLALFCGFAGLLVFVSRRNTVRPCHYFVLRRLIHPVRHLRQRRRHIDQWITRQKTPHRLTTSHNL